MPDSGRNGNRPNDADNIPTGALLFALQHRICLQRASKLAFQFGHPFRDGCPNDVGIDGEDPWTK